MSPIESRCQGTSGTLRVLASDGPGDPFVMAHGVGSSAQFLVDAFAAPLGNAGWRLVAFDARGHGASDPAPRPDQHPLDAHVDDLAVVVDAFGARAVGGVSRGAHAAVALAAWSPDEFDVVLACLPAWTGRAVPGEGTHAAVAEAVRSNGIDEMIAGFRRDETLQPWLREVLVRDWSVADPDSLRAALEALDGGTAPTERELRQLQVPLGLVTWPDDPGHPLEVAQDWCTWSPTSDVEVIDIGDLNRELSVFGDAAVRVLDRLIGRN